MSDARDGRDGDGGDGGRRRARVTEGRGTRARAPCDSVSTLLVIVASVDSGRRRAARSATRASNHPSRPRALKTRAPARAAPAQKISLPIAPPAPLSRTVHGAPPRTITQKLARWRRGPRFVARPR
eukprot:31177-Pelagococcus_subviridis.AAC.11